MTDDPYGEMFDADDEESGPGVMIPADLAMACCEFVLYITDEFPGAREIVIEGEDLKKLYELREMIDQFQPGVPN